MSIQINTVVAGEQFEVNGKLVYLDHNQNWVATVELTTQEKEQFNKHLATLNNKPTAKE